MQTPADSIALPAHARVLADDRVWIEGDALVQLARVSALDGCVRAVGMPDLHPGRGIPIGAAFAFDGRIHPALIGGDAGCGALVVATDVTRAPLDALERRARTAFDHDPLADADPGALLDAVFRFGPRALCDVTGVDPGLAAFAAHVAAGVTDRDAAIALPPWARDTARTLGTIGGGNHFVEIARVDAVLDEARAHTAGLARGSLVVLAHSGSRSLGGALAREWGSREFTAENAGEYLAQLAGARRYARTNRIVIAYRLLRALGAARNGAPPGTFDVSHNDVTCETVEGRSLWVHRKGAAPAYANTLTVVLGSRGASSWVMAGTGNADTLSSAAHGAGRKMGRGEAREKLKARYRRADLARTALGSRVVCDDADLLFEEHPDAYKPVEAVICALEEAGAATRVASLTPVLTVKR